MKHKKVVAAIVMVLVILFCLVCVLAAIPVNAYEYSRITTAKQDVLHNAADMLRWEGYSDDSPEIRALSAAWWEEEEALNIVAKVIQNEADPLWCEWEHSVAVGAVVMNRVASPYFPNTVREVVAAPGQYLEAYTRDFSGVSRLAYEAAKVAIDGDHDVPSDAYWQAEFPQGKEVWKTFCVDTGWYTSTTFICRGVA